MKTVKLLIHVPLMAFFIQNTVAKGQSTALYLTVQDYLNHKLSYGTGSDRVKVSGLFETNYVILTHDGKKQVLPKNEIFGYRENNRDYRFYNNLAYQIDDATGFYIYSNEQLLPQLPGKGPKPTKVSYFSKSLNDEILPLTPENLAKAFPKNTKFRLMVEVAAKTEMKLDAYDSLAGEYKIKELYAESLK